VVDSGACVCEAELWLSLRAPKLLMLELAERVAAACVVRQVRAGACVEGGVGGVGAGARLSLLLSLSHPFTFPVALLNLTTIHPPSQPTINHPTTNQPTTQMPQVPGIERVHVLEGERGGPPRIQTEGINFVVSAGAAGWHWMRARSLR